MQKNNSTCKLGGQKYNAKIMMHLIQTEFIIMMLANVVTFWCGPWKGDFIK